MAIENNYMLKGNGCKLLCEVDAIDGQENPLMYIDVYFRILHAYTIIYSIYYQYRVSHSRGPLRHLHNCRPTQSPFSCAEKCTKKCYWTSSMLAAVSSDHKFMGTQRRCRCDQRTSTSSKRHGGASLETTTWKRGMLSNLLQASPCGRTVGTIHLRHSTQPQSGLRVALVIGLWELTVYPCIV